MDCVFVHGLGQSPTSWDGAISRLPDDITVVCPDLSRLIEAFWETYRA